MPDFAALSAHPWVRPVASLLVKEAADADTLRVDRMNEVQLIRRIEKQQRDLRALIVVVATVALVLWAVTLLVILAD